MEAPEKNVQRLVMEVDLVDLVVSDVSDVRQHRELMGFDWSCTCTILDIVLEESVTQLLQDSCAKKHEVCHQHDEPTPCFWMFLGFWIDMDSLYIF